MRDLRKGTRESGNGVGYESLSIVCTCQIHETDLPPPITDITNRAQARPLVPLHMQPLPIETGVRERIPHTISAFAHVVVFIVVVSHFQSPGWWLVKCPPWISSSHHPVGEAHNASSHT